MCKTISNAMRLPGLVSKLALAAGLLAMVYANQAGATTPTSPPTAAATRIGITLTPLSSTNPITPVGFQGIGSCSRLWVTMAINYNPNDQFGNAIAFVSD